MNNPPPTSFTQRLPYWLLFLTATVGVPGAAAIAFAEQLSQRPLLALGVAVLYEIVVFVVGFSAKVWQKLESNLVDRTAARLDEALQRVVSGYRKRYLQHVIYRHRNFDVKGLSTQGIYTLELEQVFVELSISPRAPHLISADPIQTVPEELQKGRFFVWDFLNAKQMEGQSLAIIGAPGSGKTTLLKHMALTLAAGKARRQQVGAPDKLPILLYLRDHAADIKENADLTLDQAVHSMLERWKLPAPPGWFEQQLKQGRCLVMLDGLDEVADPAVRQGVVAWVERQMQLFSKNRFVITSRPHGYHSNPLDGVTVLTILPFTRVQVERFVHNWYTANEIMSQQKDDPGVRMAAQEGAEDLLRRLRNTPALSELAVNPLLLTMIATVHRYRSSLPGRRVELYSEICEVFLGKRQQARGLEMDLTPAQKQRVLQPLAYHLMHQAKREIAMAEAQAVIAEALALVSPQIGAAAFLKMIENSSGLLVERESGVYSFSHLTFQEYLAAVHVQEQRLEGELSDRVAEPWWHETIRLYAAQTDATPIIAACLRDDPPALTALVLAIECQEEAREIQPEVRAKLDAMLDQGVEDLDPERRRLVAEALLALRLRRMARVDEHTYVDNSLVTHAEYQLFLDEKRAIGEYYQPDHWQSYQFPAGKGHKSVVGVRPSDAVAFCQWLTQREKGDWQFRLPKLGERNVESATDQGITYWISSIPASFYCAAIDKDDLALAITHNTVARYITTDGLPTYGQVDQLEPELDVERIFALLRGITANDIRDRALVHALNLDRIRTLSPDKRSMVSWEIDLNHVQELAYAAVLESARVPDVIINDDLEFAARLMRAEKQPWSTGLKTELASVLDRSPVIAFARDRVSTLDPAFVLSLDHRSNLLQALRRRYIRVVSLLSIDAMESWLATNRSTRIRRLAANYAIGSYQTIFKMLRNDYLVLFIDFVVLEERIRGNIEAFEGVRIMKERKRDDIQGLAE